ncbi:MAG: hypothetical protein KBF88_13330 [Polyangiaceae bacterium]|nr:hypothetical protein [Polyangiaceae bacterium]
MKGTRQTRGTPPPRLYVIPARRAPAAVVLARTSKWSHVARWNLLTGRIESGAWLQGTLYPRRCDISPNGELLYYFAMKGGQSYHAISRVPFLKALALWKSSSTYTSGAYFEDALQRSAKIRDDFWQRPPELGEVEPLLKKHRLRLRSYPATAYKAERLRGWLEHEDCLPRDAKDPWDERRKQTLYRQHPQLALRLILADQGISHALGQIEFRKPTYHLERAAGITPLPGVTWADWDSHGRLLLATDTGGLEIRDPETGACLAADSLAGIRPNPIPSPPGAQHW